ncbi:MAG: sigma 54-interacting transcriptional regulator, partial [Anaerovoracaceae bacterium]
MLTYKSMEPFLQGKLLRVLQEGVVRRVGGTRDIPLDVRIISTTNSSMQDAIREKHFRNDLYYRLSVVDIAIPPLRARGSDILYIASHYISEFNRVFSKNVTGISDDVKE